MPDYKYLGPNSSLYVGEGKARKAHSLITGVIYSDLPEDNKTVAALKDRKLLVEAEQDEKPAAKPVKK